MTAAAPEFQLLLSERATVDRADGHIHVSAYGRSVRAPAPFVNEALARLAGLGATEDELIKGAVEEGDATALISLVGLLRALDSGGLLRRRIVCEGRDVAELIPTASAFRFDLHLPDADAPLKLSRFTYVFADRGTLVVRSPLARAKLELADRTAASALHALAGGSSIVELEAIVPALGAGPIRGLIVMLRNVGALPFGDAEESADASSPHAASGWWEFHDLLFHMRSRRGRHNAPYGGTYRHKAAPQPKLIKPAQSDDTVSLPRPDYEHLRQTEAPFSDVLEQRRSVRDYGPEPPTFEQLGEFLYRSARYQAMPAQVPQCAFRAAPAGGALQELEIYPVVAQCRGLEAGVYHYRPLEHVLTRIARPSPLTERLLDEARQTANKDTPLHIYFQITARCQRVFWKYESMAYALILKNLGALYATMYFVATAMHLAPCALGGGDSELFAAITGLDPIEEPAVGEFLLGSRSDG
jgi:SagB-type dehydrogenase family enzyme